MLLIGSYGGDTQGLSPEGTGGREDRWIYDCVGGGGGGYGGGGGPTNGLDIEYCNSSVKNGLLSVSSN